LFRSEPTPGVRYGSNLTVYDEQLIRGRYVGHYHTTVGRLKYTQVADRLLDEMVGRRPVEAFALNVDGFSLSSHWHWSGATEERAVPALPGVRHAIVELTHELRPIQIKIHTQLDSTPFLVRWLEITNTGTQPAALAEVVPWSGLLWVVPQYRSRLPESADAVFKLGYFAQTRFGHEGDFTWGNRSEGFDQVHILGFLGEEVRVHLFGQPKTLSEVEADGGHGRHGGDIELTRPAGTCATFDLPDEPTCHPLASVSSAHEEGLELGPGRR
jgi:hypothetical protein